jgi:antirestriction protein ArdC
MNSTVPSQSKFNVYSAITDGIVESIKAGAGSFTMPWHGNGSVTLPLNASTDAPYRGINILALWASAVRQRFPTGHWASFKQWKYLGAHVKKGEHGSLIVFYKEFETELLPVLKTPRLGVFIEPEVGHGKTEVHEGVQA